MLDGTWKVSSFLLRFRAVIPSFDFQTFQQQQKIKAYEILHPHATVASGILRREASTMPAVMASCHNVANCPRRCSGANSAM